MRGALLVYDLMMRDAASRLQKMTGRVSMKRIPRISGRMEDRQDQVLSARVFPGEELASER